MHLVQSLTLFGALLQLLQALGNVEYQIDQHPIRLVLDFVALEEHVRFEVEQSFIDDVQAIVFIGRIQTRDRSSYFGSKREQREIADLLAGHVCDLGMVDLQPLGRGMC